MYVCVCVGGALTQVVGRILSPFLPPGFKPISVTCSASSGSLESRVNGRMVESKNDLVFVSWIRGRQLLEHPFRLDFKFFQGPITIFARLNCLNVHPSAIRVRDKPGDVHFITLTCEWGMCSQSLSHAHT